MRTIILLTSLLFSIFIYRPIANAQSATNKSSNFDQFTQDLIKTWIKGAETNGICCAISFDRPSESGASRLVCYVHLVNGSTSFLYGGLSASPDMLFEVELFDSKDNSIAKTHIGEKYGQSVTQQQLIDWYKTNVNRHGAGTFLVPPFLTGDINQFIVTQVFQIQKAGEYTLHLRMRLIQRQQDSSEKLNFSIIWLPEVVAQIEIRPEDIPPPDLQSNIQTNSAAK
jgi:hypothetical protein